MFRRIAWHAACSAAALVACALVGVAQASGAVDTAGATDQAEVHPADTDALHGERRAALVADLAASGIRDSATLAAIAVVPRHEFVLPRHRMVAYQNEAFPIAEGQTTSQPLIVAVMTEAIRPRPGMKVLEVGTGAGYQAAVLAEAGCQVFSIEIVRALADSARVRLARLGYGDIHVRHGDGYLGWPEAAPFDAILVTAAPEKIPEPLIEQLAPGGRLVAPLGGEDEVQSLTLLEKDARGRTSRRVLLPVRFVPLRRDVR